jgi:class 3 adenylate cyclase/tetratricopeptide (TPR) repeat protein
MSATVMQLCAACGEQTPAAKRFCIHCGIPTLDMCATCGEPVVTGAKFCGECGSPVDDHGAAAASVLVSERRLVSVLFADLVGFTTLSEHRDPEEIRELLTRYFDRCKALIERHGGTVEKFIGDAVVAVWGTPVAREDDAERAVRAGLALTAAVGELSGELRLRVGVLTGPAAVELGAEREGMVMGDTVNTASRLQSLAAPGAVLVDDVTRRASEAAIAYEDAGGHSVKGREQAVHAWRALRVVAGARGARRSVGLEAPFVGRERELQAIIEAGEQSARHSQARRIVVLGEAGTGKSRLLWEFFKYLDGIEEERWWHQGRCLSYGEGVAYWALAEMVRTRAQITDEESPAVAREKLRAAVAEHVDDERERRLVEPRLAHLLRLEERPEADRADLFSGWRLFFERMADANPVILAFEDLQWADGGLLEFIDYLMEWSADSRIFVLALGRPELHQRRSSWAALQLEPLPLTEIAAMLDGLAPGLPEELVVEIGRRSEGIPLYAVETIRMLQDRGLLVQEGARYVLAGDVSDLEVPETLRALVASRLDGLSSPERSLLQKASVLGHAFTTSGAAALAERPEPEVSRLLDELVAKQVLSRDDDPRSPERGQYVFLQALLRTVAYGMLSRRTRKALHLAAAHHLERTWPSEPADIAEVLASHYLEAIRADPAADDVVALRASARARLTAAGRAAASLALGPEARHYFEQAAELADDDLERAALLEQAGRALRQSDDAEAAEQQLRRAIELYQRAGNTTGGSAAVALAEMFRVTGRLDEARGMLEPFRTADDQTVDPIVRAEALAALAGALVFSGSLGEAGSLMDEALTTLEEQEAWPALANALITRAVYLIQLHRCQEGGAVLQLARSLGDAHGLTAVALRARYNLAAVALESGRPADAVREVDDALVQARERGDRGWERMLLSQSIAPLVVLGRWDQAEPIAVALLTGTDDPLSAVYAAAFLIGIAAARGDRETWQSCREIAETNHDTSHTDLASAVAVTLARDALESEAPRRALTLARPVLSALSTATESVEEAYAICIAAAVSLGDESAIAELESYGTSVPPVRATPLLRAGRARLAAEQAYRRGDEESASSLQAQAISLLRSVGARPLLATALLELAARHHDGEADAEARVILHELRATRWLQRPDAAAAGVAV